MASTTTAAKNELRQRTYTLGKRGVLRVCFEEEANLAWTDEEIAMFVDMWKAGAPIGDIYEALRRPPVDVDLLALWLGYAGDIKPRPGGALGPEWRNR